MNLFMAVQPRDKATVAAYKDALLQAVPIVVPFARQPHQARIWSNEFALAASFSIHASDVPIQDYAAETPRRFCTFNGIPLLDDNLQSAPWGSFLLHSYESGLLHPERLGGYYNLLIVDDDTVHAWNCLSRVEPLYYAENGECAVIGNRASLMYAVANRTAAIEYDASALISLVTAGWLAHDRVPFKDVELLPNGTYAVLRDGRVRLSPYKPYTFREITDLTEHQADALYDKVCEELLRGTRFFSKFAGLLRLNLSGGKDSRIMAALCVRAGINVTCVTSGGPDDRDVIVAGEVARMLDLPHEATPPQADGSTVPRIDVFEQIRMHVAQSDGMTNAWDPIYPIRLKAGILLNGHCGEAFRGGYEMIREGHRPRITDVSVAATFLRNITLRYSHVFLTLEGIRAQESMNYALLGGFLESTFPLGHLYEYVYVVYREGRGVANLRQGAAYGAFAFSPFLNCLLYTSPSPRDS